ncbi:hypothetical protein [Chelativorans intermedius]|uniref:Uncharacterized protein n=1 Tax=Chelativorans intermedius TaxID=515947 RepID=A0ABV6DC11_9HYPH|nr:hypothetical protein [Chelativorans intermedius]MCT9000300.1 hypothetical protein [Chelativorans intermedius]
MLWALALTLWLTAPSNSFSAGEIPVAISVQAAIEGERLRISGRASVPDGAWIIYAVYRPATPQRRTTGYAQIDDGRFSAKIDVSDWPPGEIAVDTHFQLLMPHRVQPDGVIDRFGPNGERMIGDSVVEGGNAFRAAIASTTVAKP